MDNIQKTCPVCGAKCAPEATFCTACGSSMSAPAAPATPVAPAAPAAPAYTAPAAPTYNAPAPNMYGAPVRPAAAAPSGGAVFLRIMPIILTAIALISIFLAWFSVNGYYSWTLIESLDSHDIYYILEIQDMVVPFVLGLFVMVVGWILSVIGGILLACGKTKVLSLVGNIIYTMGACIPVIVLLIATEGEATPAVGAILAILCGIGSIIFSAISKRPAPAVAPAPNPYGNPYRPY